MGTKKERILQKLNPMLLRMTPKLSGDAGSFIDLDSEESLEDGAKKLMMRFFRNQDMCEKNRQNPVQSDAEVTILSAKYNENEEICDLITEKLTLPFVRNDDSEIFEKPGRRLQKLKTELQEKMSAKWEEEYKKRISENESFGRKHKQSKKKSHGKSGNCESPETEDDEDIDGKSDDGGNSDDGDDADVESEEEENESDKVSICDDGENVTNKDSQKNKERTPEKDYEYDDSEACSLVPAYQPGGGLLYGGSELTQGDEGLPQNLLSPSLRLNVNESPGSKTQSESFNDRTPKKAKSITNEDCDGSFTKETKLFSQNPNNSFDLSDAFEFCSGKFPDTNPTGTQNVAEEKSDASCDEEVNEDDEENGSEFEEEENDVENLFEETSTGSEPEKNFPKTRKNIVAFEDSEEEEEAEAEKETENEQCLEPEEILPGPSKLLSDDEDEADVEGDIKSKKRTRKNLHFSDEEDGSGCEDEGDGQGDGSSEKGDDDEDLENEEEDCDNRSIHYDSEENEITNPKEFFEKEAELSGSEWSGDEDERGLDEFDVEEGDADNLDSSLVRSQLEKIHIRRVLDDDAREVRLIQEILFEDGDLHSDGKRRDRKFKWKNLGTFGEEGNDGESKEEGGNSSEDDCAEEEQQRKLRYEKELFLMTKKKTGDDNSDEELIGDIRVVKVTRIKASGNIDTKTEKSKVITDLRAPQKSLLSNARGSFLTRNEEFLSRLAKATSSVSDNVSGPKHSRNFVFATKSPEKVSSERATACKRQVEGTESCGRQEKRMKILPPEVDTGPSILDLLV